jgi:hypothetical protein
LLHDRDVRTADTDCGYKNGDVFGVAVPMRGRSRSFPLPCLPVLHGLIDSLENLQHASLNDVDVVAEVADAVVRERLAVVAVTENRCFA